jgi:hypothetical protein
MSQLAIRAPARCVPSLPPKIFSQINALKPKDSSISRHLEPRFPGKAELHIQFSPPAGAKQLQGLFTCISVAAVASTLWLAMDSRQVKLAVSTTEKVGLNPHNQPTRCLQYTEALQPREGCHSPRYVPHLHGTPLCSPIPPFASTNPHTNN